MRDILPTMTKEQYIELLEVRLLTLEERILERIMADLTRLNNAVVKLTTDVDTLISSVPNDQAAIDSAAAAVEAVDTKVVAALPPPTP